MSIEEFYNRELNEWLIEIEFYLSEIAILKERLTDVAGKNTKAAVMAGVEHFENQFIVQKDSLQTLRHKVQLQKDVLTAEVKADTGLNNLDVVDDQHFLRDSVQMAAKIFLEVKHGFYRFLAKVF